jgi:hypothetical protein
MKLQKNKKRRKRRGKNDFDTEGGTEIEDIVKDEE